MSETKQGGPAADEAARKAALGARIREERQRLGLSQAALADCAGISKKSQTNYELGHSEPPASYLAAIAAHGADITYIVTGARRQQAALPACTAWEIDVLADRIAGVLEWHYQSLAPERKHVRDAVRAALPGIPSSEGFPPDLHPRTAALVRRFAVTLAGKLAEAERKHGYGDAWARSDWMDECRAWCVEQVAKADPGDVAAFCAFLWYHGESTATPAGDVAREAAMPQRGAA